MPHWDFPGADPIDVSVDLASGRVTLDAGPVPADRGTQRTEHRTRLAIKPSFLAGERMHAERRDDDEPERKHRPERAADAA